MMLKKTLFLFSFLFALSLIIFSLLPNVDILFLIKLIAFSLGITLIYSLFYYQFRGAKKGDKVVVVNYSFIPSFLGREGILMNNAKIGDKVKVFLDDGGEVVGVLESYEEWFSPHKVRLIYEERKI